MIKKTKIDLRIPLFFIWPFGAFLASFSTIASRKSQIIYVAFVTLFGYSFAFTGVSADSYRVALVFNFSKCIRYATFWGSDFSLAKKKGRLSYLFFKRMDKILFSNGISLKDFSSLYPKLKGKLEIIKWPLSTLELQKNVKNTDKGVFDFNILLGKQIVCVGTNGGKNQNHLKIIEELNKLDTKISDEFYFLFPAGYPKNNDIYINEIESKLKVSSLSFYHIDTSFHTEIDLAHYRNMTDILIQVQNNDMFSGAMQEAIFGGAKIITGSWLPYEILDVNNVMLFKIDDFSQLSKTLIEAKDFEFSPEMKKHNAEVIYSLSGWEIIKKQWFGLYKS